MSAYMDDCLNVLSQMRAVAESLMKDTVQILRASEHVFVDPETGRSVEHYITVYEGKAKLQTYGGIAQHSTASATGESSNVGGVVPVWSLYLHLPWDARGVKPGDIAVMTDSVDPDLVGKRLRLVNLQSEKSFSTARRWNVSEMPEGGEANG